MDGTILSQGSFFALGSNTSDNSTAVALPNVILIPSNADFMWVRNHNKMGTAGTTNAIGFEFYWQRGMPSNTYEVKYYADGGAVVTGDVVTGGGFTLYDPSNPNVTPFLSAPVAVSAVTNDVNPEVTVVSTAGLSVGMVVRLSNTAQTDVNGVDMVIGTINSDTQFTLLNAFNALATAPGVVGGIGFYRIVYVDFPFYPRKRVITDITLGNLTGVSTAIPHGLTPGQSVRFNIPAVSGTIQLNATSQNNYLTATVVTVLNDYEFSCNINSTNFTAFTYPTVAQQPSSLPLVIPVGEDTASALVSPFAQTPMVAGVQIPNTNTGILADATVNTNFLGMILGPGGNGEISMANIVGPAGTITNVDNVQYADQMFWVAGKSSLGGL